MIESEDRIATATGMRRRPPLRSLIDGGDWACAHGDGAALAEVARQLVVAVTRTTQFELAAIAELAHLDLDLATGRWATLADRLRAGRT